MHEEVVDVLEWLSSFSEDSSNPDKLLEIDLSMAGRRLKDFPTLQAFLPE